MDCQQILKYVCLLWRVASAFGVYANLKVGDSNPPQVETFSVSKSSTLSQEHSFVSQKWMLWPAHISHFKCLLKKYLHRQNEYSNTWDGKCLALIAHVVRSFVINPKVGGSSSPEDDTFSVSKNSTFHKNIRSWVENECCCSSTVHISNVNFIVLKIFIANPVFKYMGQQMSGLDSLSGWSIRHESEGWGLEFPSGRHILCL